MPAATLSDYQCECANPNAAKTPQTYKQGPVVRLDRDVREVQKWAGIEDPKGASMTRDTRTALRDKIAEYQKQNGLDAKTPGELNQATLDRMRQDKTLPEGLADSLQKVKPYYKPEALPRITCVTKPGETAPEAGANTAAPAKPPRTLDSYKLADGKGMDVDQRELPRIQAEALQNITRDFQRRQGMGQSGLMDQGTIDRMKSTPGYEAFGRQIESWKKDGLVDGQGRWDQKRDADIRAQVAAAQKPQAPRAAEPSGIGNMDPAEWKKKWQAGAAEAGQGKPADPLAGTKGSSGLQTLEWRSDRDSGRPNFMTLPNRVGDSGGTFMPASGERFNFESTIQPTFVTAIAHSGPQSLEVMARAPKQDGPAVDADATARMTQRNQFTPG